MFDLILVKKRRKYLEPRVIEDFNFEEKCFCDNGIMVWVFILIFDNNKIIS